MSSARSTSTRRNEHYPDAICPGLVWWAKTIRLTDEEVEAFAQDPTSVDAIVLKICDDPGSFKGRRLPQAQADALREFGAKSKGP